MTIAGWVLFALFAFIIGAFAVGAFMEFDSVAAKSISVIVGVILIFALLFGMFWYFDNTASGQRALLDQKSDFNNGVVCITTYGDDGQKQDDYGIEFVCQENTSIANWTGTDKQYVMGIATTYNNSNFEQLNGMNVESEEWLEKFEKIDDRFRVYKVKDHSFLAIGEKIGFLSVVEIQE